jgi:hypothetical protein
MFLQEQSKRAQRKQAAQDRANSSAQVAPSQVSSQASSLASTPASAAPAGNTTAPVDLADAIDMSGIDSSMLASIASGGAARRV